MSAGEAAAWWQTGILYQIYPRSFQDSDGDGVGDLAGITRRLDYLAWLGVDAIWLSPIYPSPMADFGYDVSDYLDVDQSFGTLADFDRLAAEAHRRGLRLILDYVPNHSSDRHPWFVESRSSRTAAKRDWYIWRDPRPDGSLPNNWLSEFGGPAWEPDPATGQCYYHAYLKQQPDLNWRNPAVRAAMHDVLRFWLERGVDGFRIDALHHLIKDDRFRDNPANPDFKPGMLPGRTLKRLYTIDRPEVHEAIAGLRKVLDEYADRLLIAEIHLPLERLMAYYGAALDEIHLPFNFGLLNAPWSAPALQGIIQRYEAALPAGAWPNWVLGNHDSSRIATRAGPKMARLAAMLLLTLRGTPTMYYGDELGMTDVPIPPARVQDPVEKNVPGLGLGRDPERTPMRWSPDPKGGFTTGRPWLPLDRGVGACNVETQSRDPRSMLSLYRRLIALRRSEAALVLGELDICDAEPECLAFIRHRGQDRLLVVLNFAGGKRRLPLQKKGATSQLIFSSDAARAPEPVADGVELRPGEGVVLNLA